MTTLEKYKLVYGFVALRSQFKTLENIAGYEKLMKLRGKSHLYPPDWYTGITSVSLSFDNEQILFINLLYKALKQNNIL